MLTKKELERRRERSGRTVLALLCVSCQIKNFCLWPTGAFLQRLGTANIVQLAFFSVDLDRDFPAEEIAGGEWCSDAFVSLLEELKILFFLYQVKIVWRRSSLHPKKLNLAGNRDGARLYFLLSSTILWCCNFQISALERTLSWCLLSISIDFTPFPVKLISARAGIRMYTCRCISPNDFAVISRFHLFQINERYNFFFVFETVFYAKLPFSLPW